MSVVGFATLFWKTACSNRYPSWSPEQNYFSQPVRPTSYGRGGRQEGVEKIVNLLSPQFCFAQNPHSCRPLHVNIANSDAIYSGLWSYISPSLAFKFRATRDESLFSPPDRFSRNRNDVSLCSPRATEPLFSFSACQFGNTF